MTVAPSSGYADMVADKWQGKEDSAGVVHEEVHKEVLFLVEGCTLTQLVSIL